MGAGLAQHAGDTGERLEVVGARALGRQQKKQHVDGFAVQRLEIDRLLQPCEQPEEPLQLRQLAMRDRDTLADPGRAEPLALKERVKDLPLVPPDQTRRVSSQIVQRLLLGLCPEGGRDRLRTEKV